MGITKRPPYELRELPVERSMYFEREVEVPRFESFNASLTRA
jgi:hypothetical protein